MPARGGLRAGRWLATALVLGTRPLFALAAADPRHAVSVLMAATLFCFILGVRAAARGGAGSLRPLRELGAGDAQKA